MLYVSSSCIKGNKIGEIVEEYAKSGIKNIELSGGTQYYDGWQEELLELKCKYSLNYAFHAYFPPPQEDFVVNLAAYSDDIGKKSLEYYLSNIPTMQYLGCDTLSIHAGFFVEVNPQTIGRDIGAERLYNQELAEQCFVNNYLCLAEETRKNGIKILLENNVLSWQNYMNFKKRNFFMLTNLQEYRELYQRMPFDFLLDLGHLHVSCNTLELDFESQARELLEQAKWIHISDNSGMVDEHRLVGENSIVLEQLLKSKMGDIPATMETKGSLEQVANNYRMVLEKLEQ